MWGIGIPSQMKDRIFEKGILNPKFILKCNPKLNAVAWRWLGDILTSITKIPQQSWTSLKVEEASQNMALDFNKDWWLIKEGMTTSCSL